MSTSLSKSFSKIRGFTLIELLVVIAIISILTAIVVTNFSGPKSKARDAKRISDLGNIQLAISLYFDRCKQFPATLVPAANNCNVSGVTLGNYISTIPTAPTPGASYVYDVNSAKTDYILQIVLEGYNDMLKDDVDGSIVLTGTTDCGTANNVQGTSERNYCLGSK